MSILYNVSCTDEWTIIIARYNIFNATARGLYSPGLALKEIFKLRNYQRDTISTETENGQTF